MKSISSEQHLVWLLGGGGLRVGEFASKSLTSCDSRPLQFNDVDIIRVELGKSVILLKVQYARFTASTSY